MQFLSVSLFWFLSGVLSLSSRSGWVAAMQHPNFETRHPLQTDEQQETGVDPLNNFNKNRSSTSNSHTTRLGFKLRKRTCGKVTISIFATIGISDFCVQLQIKYNN